MAGAEEDPGIFLGFCSTGLGCFVIYLKRNSQRGEGSGGIRDVRRSEWEGEGGRGWEREAEGGRGRERA